MNVKKILKEHKDLFLGLVMICGISLISIFGNTEWFRASILQVPEKFDGAIYPIEKVPNRFTWGGNNKITKFSEISQANLLDIANYTEAIGGKTPSEIKEESPEKQAKLTYPVVYLGNYDIENRIEGKGSHLAVDIRVPAGTPIRAVANGKIVKAVKTNSGFGKHIVLEVRNVPEYGNKNKKTNYFVSYAHLSEVDVKVGEIVKRGQKIGKTGSSGTSTTPHLHFQIDSKNAPWHPYWPFTAAEAYGANLNFFTAIKEGLGKENAEKYTINPLIWINENINKNLDTLNKISTNGENTGKTTEKNKENKEVVNFEISGNEEFTTDKNLELKITAKDLNKKTILDFTPASDIEISSTSNTAKFSKILKFKHGVAKVLIENPQAEEFKFEVKTKDSKFSKTITSKEEETSAVAKIEKETQVIKVEKEVASLESDSENTRGSATEENTSTGTEVSKEVVIKKEEENKNEIIKEDKVVNEKTEEENIKTEEKEVEIIKEDEVVKEDEKVLTQEVSKEIKQVEKTEEKTEEENLHESASEVKENAFTDVLPEHKNYEAIKYLKENGVIGGYKDGSFKPEKTVSRVEAVKMIFAGLKISTENSKTLTFSDTTNDAWYSPFVGAALEKGIVKGYSDGSFKPSKSVNRSEYYKILLLSAEINPSNPSENPFLDVPKDSWFGAYIGFVKDANLVKTTGENFFPAEGVSRAEVAESLYNLVKFLEK